MRARSLFLVATGLAVFAAVAVAASAQAFPDLCDADLEIGVEQVGAVVSSTAGTTVGTSGVVTLQKPPGTQAVVNLSASSDNGWPAAVWPESVTVDADDKAYFWVSVEVPRATASGPAGHVIVNARVQVESFACAEPAPDSVAIQVWPYVDVFGARIPADSRHVSPSGTSETFKIEVDAMSNAPMRVTFEYTSGGGVLASGPLELVIDPTFTTVSTQSITVTVLGDMLQPGTNVVDILVVGHQDHDPPLRGHLGYTVLAPEGAGAAGQIYPAVAPLAAAVAFVAFTAFALHQRGVGHRRRAEATLRNVMRARAGLALKARK